MIVNELLNQALQLYSHTQPFPGWPGPHQDSRPLVRIATVLLKADDFTLVNCDSEI